MILYHLTYMTYGYAENNARHGITGSKQKERISRSRKKLGKTDHLGKRADGAERKREKLN